MSNGKVRWSLVKSKSLICLLLYSLVVSRTKINLKMFTNLLNR